jgi:hypothetical protein
LATASLVLGLLSIVLGLVLIGGVLGIIAFVLGLVAYSRARKGAPGLKRALFGWITGLVGALIAVGVLIALVSSFGGRINTWARCVQQANGNNAQVQICDQQFGHSLTNR